MICTEAYKEHIEYTFNAFCRVVIRYAAINAWRDRDKRRQILTNGNLAAALSSLPEKKREIIYLYFFGRYTQQEIGELYGRCRSFFALIFGIFKNRQYCAVQRGIRKKSSLPFGKSASCPWREGKEKNCLVSFFWAQKKTHGLQFTVPCVFTLFC